MTRISCLLLYDFQLSGSCPETSINSHDPTLQLLLPMETHRVWLQQTPHSLCIPEVCVLCMEHLKCQIWFIPNDSKCVFLSMFYCSLIFLSILIKYFSRCFLRSDTGVLWHRVFANSQQTPQLLTSHLSDAFISKVTYSIFITGPVPMEWPEVKRFATSLTTKPPLQCSRRQNIHSVFVKCGHFRALILFPLTAAQRMFPSDLTA